MSLLESISMSLRSLLANKLRAGLTMLGIIIGTGAVIALLAAGEGAQAAITEQIQSIGSNLIFVVPGRFEQGGMQTTLSNYSPLTRQDADALADYGQTNYVAYVAPQIERSAIVTYHSESFSTSVIGTTPDFEIVRNYRAELGSFLTLSDESTAARTAVIGARTARSLFGEAGLALGQTIRINRVPFTVIGVLEEKGGQGFGGSPDNVVIIPLSTAHQKLFSGRFQSQQGQTIDVINISAVDEQSIDAAIDEITWILRGQRGIEFEEDDFTVTSQQDVLGVFDQITSVLTIFLGAIAGISLLVGGIGIMNIMLVSVTERTREIGIRKAVGAKRRDILWQFLIESVVLSVVGGLTGIGVGWLITRIVNSLGSFRTVVSPGAVFLAVGFSVAVGLFFGIYPASRASNLNPIEALRYE
ncbi:MAG: ABC transporter permease [Anaerolineae bacterium]